MDRELARIKAVQHRHIKARYGNTNIQRNPLEFPEWFLNCFRHYEEQGANITIDNELGNIQIHWPGSKEIVVRSRQDLADEYYFDYLPQFGKICSVPFEEGVFA